MKTFGVRAIKNGYILVMLQVASGNFIPIQSTLIIGDRAMLPAPTPIYYKECLEEFYYKTLTEVGEAIKGKISVN